MRATELVEYKLGAGGTEWRVRLEFKQYNRPQYEDYKAIKNWLLDNCPGIYEKDFVLCSHANFVAFLRQEDATLFYLAFA